MNQLFKSIVGRFPTPDERRRRRREERRRERRRRRRAAEETEAEEEEEEERRELAPLAPFVRALLGAGPEAHNWDPVPEGVPCQENQTWTNRVQFGYIWQGQMVVLGDLGEGYCMAFTPEETSRRRLDWSRCLDIGSHGIVDASDVVLPFLREEGSFLHEKMEEFLKKFK